MQNSTLFSPNYHKSSMKNVEFNWVQAKSCLIQLPDLQNIVHLNPNCTQANFTSNPARNSFKGLELQTKKSEIA